MKMVGLKKQEFTGEIINYFQQRGKPSLFSEAHIHQEETFAFKEQVESVQIGNEKVVI